MKLYFQHSDGSFEFVCDIKDGDKQGYKINADLHRRNPKFVSYYQRVWTADDLTWIDVGSHTEFYVIAPDDKRLEDERV